MATAADAVQPAAAVERAWRAGLEKAFADWKRERGQQEKERLEALGGAGGAAGGSGAAAAARKRRAASSAAKKKSQKSSRKDGRKSRSKKGTKSRKGTKSKTGRPARKKRKTSRSSSSASAAARDSSGSDSGSASLSGDSSSGSSGEEEDPLPDVGPQVCRFDKSALPAVSACVSEFTSMVATEAVARMAKRSRPPPRRVPRLLSARSVEIEGEGKVPKRGGTALVKSAAPSMAAAAEAKEKAEAASGKRMVLTPGDVQEAVQVLDFPESYADAAAARADRAHMRQNARASLRRRSNARQRPSNVTPEELAAEQRALFAEALVKMREEDVRGQRRPSE
jgi:hypothetical protein